MAIIAFFVLKLNNIYLTISRCNRKGGREGGGGGKEKGES